MNKVLEINNLNKSYEGFGLRDINMTLEAGTITGFIGPNGAGKTTTIKSILNLLNFEQGSISILGMDSIKDEMAIKPLLGIVLENGYFYDHFTLDKMKKLIAPMFPNWDEDLYQSYQKKFQLPGKKRIRDLSRGMRMKYTISLALSHGAELFIFDEPTAGLDALVRKELMDILRELVCDHSKTVLMSTHVTQDLEKTADYLYFIYNGQIILHGAKDEIKEQHAKVTGPASILTPEMASELIGVSRSAYGFDALCSRPEVLRKQWPETVIFEAPSIEEIMLYYTKEEQHD